MNKVNLKDNKFQVFDDIIPKPNQDEIENQLLDGYFPWYYNESTVHDPKTFENHLSQHPTWKNDFQMTHSFVWDGECESNWITPLDAMLIVPLQLKNIIRMKANLQINNGFEVQENPPHVDSKSYDHYVGLYYVSDSDGDTVLYEEDKITELARISPKKGRMVFFRGDIYHSSSVPKEYRLRPVININLKNTFV